VAPSVADDPRTVASMMLSMGDRQAGCKEFDVLGAAIDLDQQEERICVAHVRCAYYLDLHIMYLTQGAAAIPPHALGEGATILKEPFTIDQLRSAVLAVYNGAHQAERGT
jgi:hypothetical protein